MKRLLSLLTTITLLINTLSILAVPVSAATVSDFVYENYSVKYTVKSEKVQTKAIEITLKNTGTEAMYSWALGFDATGKISGLKGAEVYGSEETSYILKNTEKNFELGVGKSVVISYTLTGTKLATPKVFELMSYRVFAENGFEAKLHRDDKKIETFEGGVTVTNTGETPIEAWAVSFDANFTIDKFKSGQTLNYEDKRYTISNTDRQTPIAPGESFEIAFSAKNGVGVIPKIENVTLTKVEITAKENANVPQIEAWAEYKGNTLTLKWESSLPVGKFTLYESSDDKTYTERIELKNKFEYIYKYGFEKRFFKVVQTRDGITSESIAFVVEKTTDPVTGELIFVSANPDNDGDGLENYIEDILGTDREKADTDNDGLTDYEEVYLSGSDPLIYDSIKAGVSDANADADEDGLNTKREIGLGTNPLDEDSDYDGLDDGAEVNTYHTNPLKSDTDGDFIPDGDELALGLNPNSAATNGVPDNQRTKAQTVGKNSESLQYINSKSDTKFSLQITAAGLADNSLSSGESGYAAVMNNPAIIGVIPEFTYTDGLSVSEVTIAAEIAPANRANTVGTYAELNPEFEGIKRLNFFRYFEEINTLLPVETTFDISKNMMYTKTDELGTYCIMDMEIWLDSLGGAELLAAAQAETEPETEPEAQTMRAFSAANLRLESKVEFEPLGTTMAVSPALPRANEAARQSLAATDNYNIIFVATGTIETGASIDEFMQITANENWNIEPYYIGNYNGMQAGALANKCDISLEIEKALNTHYDPNKENFLFVIVREDLIYSDTPTGLSLRNKVLNYTTGKIHLSIVSNYSSLPEESFFAQLVDTTSGTLFNTNGYEETDDYEKAEYIAWDIYNWLIGGAEYKYISSVGLTELPSVFNKAYLSSIYSDQTGSGDYDKDGLSDFSEIAFESGLINRTPLEMPTINQCQNYVWASGNRVYLEDSLDRFKKEMGTYDYITKTFATTKIVPINSDPVLADGDGDWMLDSIDNELSKDIYDTQKDASPLYTFSNTNKMYGYNSANIYIEKTKKDASEFYDNSLIIIYNHMECHANIKVVSGTTNAYNEAAVGRYRFTFEAQEYMQSVCDTVIAAYENSDASNETKEFLNQYLTPELIIAIGMPESGWAEKNNNKLGIIYEGAISVPKSIGGYGASTILNDYYNFRSGVAGSAIIIAHAIKEQIEGGYGDVYHNQRNEKQNLINKQVIYNAFTAYGARTKNGYTAQEAAMSAAYKFYSYLIILKTRNRGIYNSLVVDDISDLTKFNGYNNWTFTFTPHSYVTNKRIDIGVDLDYS